MMPPSRILQVLRNTCRHHAAAPHRRRYTVAITRRVPRSLPDALSMHPAEEPISYERATAQHSSYVASLREILPTLCLPPSDEHPDCVFVEDSAICIGNCAVINRIGAPSRRGEVEAMKDVLENFGLDVIDMRDEEPSYGDGAGDEPTCDGGDALYPVGFRRPSVGGSAVHGGQHLFVGLSSRTNEAGIEVLKRAFEGGRCGRAVEVVPVPDLEGSGALHLKSIVTHVDERTLLAPKGSLGDEILLAMHAKERGYDAIRLPDVGACNVISIKGVIFAQPTKCKETRTIFEREMDYRGLGVRYIESDEFAKCDGALTCKSILLDI